MIPKDEDINSISAEQLADNLKSRLLPLEANIDATRDALTDYSDELYNVKRMVYALCEKLTTEEELK